MVILLLGVFVWGWYGFQKMPKRKDPSIPIRVAVASTQWPGATAQEVEQLVSRPIEQTMAQNSFVRPPAASDFGIRSLSFPGLSLVYIQLDDSVKDTKKQFSDINLKLDSISSRLPQGAGPIQFNSDFGDTSALMLTVASPPATGAEIAVRALSIRRAIEEERRSRPATREPRVSVVYPFPQSVNADLVRGIFQPLMNLVEQEKVVTECHPLRGNGFIGADCLTDRTNEEIGAAADRVTKERLHRTEIHPDAWQGVLIRDPQETTAKLAAVAGDRYSYRELDDFTDLIARTVQGAPEVAKVERRACCRSKSTSTTRSSAWRVRLQPGQIEEYSGGPQRSPCPPVHSKSARRTFTIDPSGKFQNAAAIGDVIIGMSSTAANSPVYLRDLVDISRAYQSPPRYLNYLTWQMPDGQLVSQPRHLPWRSK